MTNVTTSASSLSCKTVKSSVSPFTAWGEPNVKSAMKKSICSPSACQQNLSSINQTGEDIFLLRQITKVG